MAAVRRVDRESPDAVPRLADRELGGHPLARDLAAEDRREHGRSSHRRRLAPGHGIYFGDAACTSSFYTTPGKKKTRLIAIARVALGKMMDYTKITYGLSTPPPGYDSCHGVRAKTLRPSQFADDEYVVYDTRQQRVEYVVEVAA